MLRRLGIGAELDRDDLVRRVGEAVGLPIELEATALPVPGFFGMTLLDSAGYVIFYQQETTTLHQTHHIVHELAHILCGTVESVECEKAGGGAHRRGDYTTPAERDAEVVASIILSWATTTAGVASPPQNNTARHRLAAALEDSVAWT
ncbi:hypothetical protein [Rhodococcus jostii]|uniref:hypothetical protein n=1 Tax=Rhodococcus jostii TaxID=132919 RepID=UPI003625516D